MSKILYLKARISLYLSIAAVIVMLLNLKSPVREMMIAGLLISFLLAIWAIISGIINLRFIYKNEEKYRGDSMCWIAISIGVIVALSTLPFIITVFYSI